MLDFAQLQKEVDPWSERNFGKTPSWQPLIGAMEELGELAHAHLKNVQGIRGIDDDKYVALAEDAIGDICVFLAHYCARSGLDFQRAVEATWDEVKMRDWVKNAHAGV